MAEPETYDAIVSQPSHPWLAGSSALYTVEFFNEAKRALKPGGVLALWSNLFRMDTPHLKSITRTLLEVFDHIKVFVVETSSFIFVAGDQPLNFDENVSERLHDPGLRPFLEPFALDDIIDLAGTMELDTEGARAWSQGAPLIVDDRPALEFDLAKIPHFDSISEAQMDRSLLPFPWMSRSTLEGIPAELRAPIFVQRLDYARHRRNAMQRLQATVQAETELLSETDRALIEGVAAQQQGNTRGALEALARARDDSAAMYRTEEILRNERMWHQLLRATREAPELPPSARPALTAALAIDRPQALERALEIATAVDNSGDAALKSIVKARLSGGCAAVFEVLQDEANATALQNEQVNELAARCSRDEETARPFREQALRLRRVAAADLVEVAQEADNHGNSALAKRVYIQAFRAFAGNPRAAAGAARGLHRDGDEAGAEAVLRRAHGILEGLKSDQLITQAADELGIENL